MFTVISNTFFLPLIYYHNSTNLFTVKTYLKLTKQTEQDEVIRSHRKLAPHLNLHLPSNQAPGSTDPRTPVCWRRDPHTNFKKVSEATVPPRASPLLGSTIRGSEESRHRGRIRGPFLTACGPPSRWIKPESLRNPFRSRADSTPTTPATRLTVVQFLSIPLSRPVRISLGIENWSIVTRIVGSNGATGRGEDSGPGDKSRGKMMFAFSFGAIVGTLEPRKRCAAPEASRATRSSHGPVSTLAGRLV